MDWLTALVLGVLVTLVIGGLVWIAVGLSLDKKEK